MAFNGSSSFCIRKESECDGSDGGGDDDDYTE